MSRGVGEGLAAFLGEAFVGNLEDFGLTHVGFQVPCVGFYGGFAVFLGEFADAEVEVAPVLGEDFGQADGGAFYVLAAARVAVHRAFGKAGAGAGVEDSVHGADTWARSPRRSRSPPRPWPAAPGRRGRCRRRGAAP